MSVPARTISIRHIAALPALVVAALAFIGCESDSSTSGNEALRGESTSTHIEQDGETDESANPLAEMAARDVEAFQRIRSKRQPESEDEQSRELEVDEDAIAWNAPRKEHEQAKRGEAELVTPGDFEPDVLARDRLEVPEPAAFDAAEPSDPEAPSDDAEDEDPVLSHAQMDELIASLSRSLYHEASHADMPLRELLVIAATTMIDPDRALAPEAIPGLTDREREMLGEFQNFFRTLGANLDGSRDAEKVMLESIENLRAALQTEPVLSIGELALCTRVGGFGDFDAFNRYTFLAHNAQQAIVYIEIDGFASEVNDDGEWVTKISQQLVIYSDRDGIPVWREDWQTAVDKSRNKRGDFFLVQLITLPEALSVGRYHLKVRIRDEITGAEAEHGLLFEMVADPKMAVRVR